jgi:hypothetical protein
MVRLGIVKPFDQARSDAICLRGSKARYALAVFALVCAWTIAVAGSGQTRPPGTNGAITAQSFREGFEDSEPGWTVEGGDVNRKVRLHDRTAENAHTGRWSERIALTAGHGTHLYYSYPIPRALIADELEASLWVKADRPGVQLLARVVFPRERDPDTLQVLGTLVPGQVYEQTGTWQRLDLTQSSLGMERQARLLRASLNRDVDTREAYIDRLLVNVYCGPGDVTVLLDDIHVRPVFVQAVRQAGAQLGSPSEPRAAPVEISQERLLVADRPRLLRVIRAPGVAPRTLKEFGLNVMTVDWPLDLQVVEDAVNSGLWLMPELPGKLEDPQAPAPDVARAVSELPFSDAVLCWYVGTGVHADAWKPATNAIRALRFVEARRPIALDVTSNLWGYSREVDMLSAHRFPLGTDMGIRRYREWLTQRRHLARPGTYFFTWIQVTAQTGDVGHVVNEAGPEPDQLRLLTYSALAAGCRGLGYWADRSLGQPGPGRERLLQLGLLNLELQLLEPYFASAGSTTTIDVETTVPAKRGPGAEVDDRRADFSGKRRVGGSFAPLPKRPATSLTEREEVQATLLRNDRGLVLIPVWYGKGAQFVAGQLAANDLNIIVPGIPDAAQAWQVTPAEVRMLSRERVAGGTRLTMPEFDLTAIVLLTSDVTAVEQVRRDVAKTCPFAARWAAELANSEVAKVRTINSQLTALGHPQPDSFGLIQSAEERLAASRAAMDRGDFPRSYAESQRAMRAVRILERAHWEDAVHGCKHQAKIPSLTVPLSSPYATSFASLPQHWQFMKQIQASQFGANLVRGGEFESSEQLSEDGWSQVMDGDQSLELRVTLSAQDPHRGERSLHMEVKAKQGQSLPASLDPMLAALVSKPIPVQAGDIVRIRFWLRVPASIQGSPEGVFIYDSLGGPALAVTQSEPLEWKQYTLYRHAIHADMLTITVGLTGIGDMYVDDLVVERLTPAGAITQERQTQRTR